MSTEQAPQAPFTIRLASALFEIEADEPGGRSRSVLWFVSVLVLILLAWAMLAKLDIVAVAQGRLVPQTYVKIVQPAEAGIVREILVDEGDAVEHGQVLVRLDPTVNAVDSKAVERELALQRLQLRRIEAELAGKTMVRLAHDDPLLFAQVEAQRASNHQSLADSLAQESAARDRALKELGAAQELLRKLEVTLPSYQKTAAAFEKLSQDNLVGAIQAEERRREAIEKERDLEAQRATVEALHAAILQHDRRMAQLQSTQTMELNQQRLAILSEVGRLEQQQGRLNFQGGLLELRAPQAGIVKDLATTTTGAVVQPGTVLVSLVPHDEPLLAEVLIENKDIGFVAINQPVRLKLAAYQFQKYGMLEGTVKNVSADSSSSGSEADAQSQQQSPLAFKAIIELKTQRLTTGALNLPLAAGMQLSAEIVQGKRTVLEYLLSPVQRVTSEAATER
jgi:HlyD family secretion protein